MLKILLAPLLVVLLVSCGANAESGVDTSGSNAQSSGISKYVSITYAYHRSFGEMLRQSEAVLHIKAGKSYETVTDTDCPVLVTECSVLWVLDGLYEATDIDIAQPYTPTFTFEKDREYVVMIFKIKTPYSSLLSPHQGVYFVCDNVIVPQKEDYIKFDSTMIENPLPDLSVSCKEGAR